MSLFISPAYAEGGAATAGGGMELIFMMVIFAVIFYFMIYRPQSKRVKEHKNLMSSLSKGDEVLTTGGLVGKIIKISEENDYFQLSLSDDTTVTLKKDFVSAVLPKGTLKSL
ncbi:MULTISPECIES: preprotein translocase subunit YajC [Agarivorans]|jgi:preprotein translocase subunit YajC|uniref:Sec translocon accessory complex subunit YajC n=1 Tax=Agarivorans aestuarii TaxID=1563703 RepID=A0ABU7GAU5_9ALTE|nr:MULTISPECIES: preprotein translocase subunit YajC [Agarivorans]MEE1675580.1 preprotein translocase subunit YajC [Agarivorans aestuarii]